MKSRRIGRFHAIKMTKNITHAPMIVFVWKELGTVFALVAKVCQTVSVEFDIGVGRLLCGRASRGIVDVASTGKDCSGTRVSGELH